MRRATSARILSAQRDIYQNLNQIENTELRNSVGPNSIHYWSQRNARLGDEIPFGIFFNLSSTN